MLESEHNEVHTEAALQLLVNPHGLRGIFNRAPALLRRAFCVVWAPRPKLRRPKKVGTPERSAASFVRGSAHPPPLAHQM
jgi:hypothetical protein